MHTDLPFLVAAAGHPSLDDAIVRFCDALRAESRWFGPRGAGSRKPSPSLIRRLASTQPGLCLAAVIDGDVIGLARIDAAAPSGPELLVAVAGRWRGRGVALTLGEAIVRRATDAGLDRIVLRTSERGDALRELASALGFQVVELGRGHIDLIRTLQPVSRSA